MMTSHKRHIYIITDLDHGDDFVGGVIAINQDEAYDIALQHLSDRMVPDSINVQVPLDDEEVEYCKKHLINK